MTKLYFTSIIGGGGYSWLCIVCTVLPTSVRWARRHLRVYMIGVKLFLLSILNPGVLLSDGQEGVHDRMGNAIMTYVCEKKG